MKESCFTRTLTRAVGRETHVRCGGAHIELEVIGSDAALRRDPDSCRKCCESFGGGKKTTHDRLRSKD